MGLGPERRQRLEQLPGWGSWDPLTDQWEDGFSYLREFSQREGHCLVSGDYKTDDDFRLGFWVMHQRAVRNKMDPNSAPPRMRSGLSGMQASAVLQRKVIALSGTEFAAVLFPDTTP